MCARQANHHPGADFLPADHLEIAAMPVHDPLGDRQPQAGAAGVSGPCGICPVKTLEDVGDIGGRDSLAVILYGKARRALVVEEGTQDDRFALRGILQRVVAEDAGGLLELRLIPLL